MGGHKETQKLGCSEIVNNLYAMLRRLDLVLHMLEFDMTFTFTRVDYSRVYLYSHVLELDSMPWHILQCTAHGNAL